MHLFHVAARLALLTVLFCQPNLQTTATPGVVNKREISIVLRDAYDNAIEFPEVNNSGYSEWDAQGQGQGHMYKLTIPIHGGQDLDIWLRRPQNRLLSSRVAVQYSEGNITVAKWLLWRCMYEGFLTSHERGSDIPGTVVSLCGGLTGVFEFSNNEFHVEPMENRDKHNTFARGHMIWSRPIIDRNNNDIIDEMNELPTTRPIPPPVEKFGTDVTKSRRRRDLIHRNPRYMEVLLVADQTVVRFHGRRLVDQYLLTIMNIVNSVYHHPSLGIEINIIVTDIVHLSDNEMQALIDEGKGKDTLQKFCNWTNERWMKTQKNRLADNMFDVAVYLTRENLGPAGYAPVTGMCNPLRSCAVIRDDGISSAFVVAHEIGHIFGMVHDGEGDAKECGNTNDGKIMSAMVQSNYRSYYWSNCSKQLMEDVLEEMYCLENEPGDTIWPRYSEPYGQTWTLNEQCRQEFGSDFVFCKALPQNCEHLWCENPKVSSMCKTKKSPPLSGTTCGKNMWCLHGKCVNMKDTPRVDGGWAEWSGWGQCSRSCGVGVKYRYRTCSAPTPQYGGKECDSTGEDFKLCKKQDCPRVTDYRKEQCQEYNEINFANGKRHNWLPIESKNMSEACKLTCISEETRDLFTTEKSVVDGTPCSYESSHDLCIRGECHPMGCDKELSSAVKEDLCGTCDGDNTDCTTVSETFMGNLGTGQYHRVVVLPADAMNIRIRETTSFHLAHFLAARDIDTEKFWLNGESKQQGNRQFVVHKTRFLYFKNKNGEYLTARGPLLAPVEILTYSFSDRIAVEIEYQYYIGQAKHLELQGPPTEAGRYTWAVTEPGRYMWAVTAFDKCTRPCGGGTQREMFECLDVENTSVSEGLCTGSHRPAGSTTPCNEHPCSTTIYIWRVKSWQKCSASCGMSGMKWRKVYCEATLLDDSWQVDDKYCHLRADATPHKHKQCNRMACPAQWKIGQWSECSATCGQGHETREYYCDKPRDDNKYTCDHLKPPSTHRTCHVQSCPESLFDLSPGGGSGHYIDEPIKDEVTMESYTERTTEAPAETTVNIITDAKRRDKNAPADTTVNIIKEHFTDSKGQEKNVINVEVEPNSIEKAKTSISEKPKKSKKRGSKRKTKGNQKNGRKRKRNRKMHKKSTHKAKNRKTSKTQTMPMRRADKLSAGQGRRPRPERKRRNKRCTADLSGLVCKIAATKLNCLNNNIYKKLCCKSCGQYLDI